MMRFRRPEFRALSTVARNEVLHEASAALAALEHPADGRQSALFSLLGHKGDLLFVHFRRTFEELDHAQRDLARLAIGDFLEPTSSYLSIVELGIYESTAKVYGALMEKGIQPYSDQWKQEIEATLDRHRQAMAPRLWPEIPATRYVCFYPMDRRRGESKNWYEESLADRQRMMEKHGAIGRRYAGEVRQIISGSIGLDDWEWGVDLFANDPAVFKRLNLCRTASADNRRSHGGIVQRPGNSNHPRHDAGFTFGTSTNLAQQLHQSQIPAQPRLVEFNSLAPPI